MRGGGKNTLNLVYKSESGGASAALELMKRSQEFVQGVRSLFKEPGVQELQECGHMFNFRSFRSFRSADIC